MSSSSLRQATNARVRTTHSVICGTTTPQIPLRRTSRSGIRLGNVSKPASIWIIKRGSVNPRIGRSGSCIRVNASDPFENLFRSSVMQSAVVQQEFASLLGDIQRLSLIGNKFPEFDLEGKKMFLEQMETAIDKFQIFVKRLELAKEDANAQEFLRYSNAQMLNAGFTLTQFVARLSSGLQEHRRWVEEEEKVLSDPERHQQFKAAMRAIWSSAPMGRLDMNGVYDSINKLDPQVVMKAHSDPQYWVAITEITQNPAAASKWMDHPNIGPLACELWRAMQSSSWNQK